MTLLILILAPRKSFDILALYKSDYYYYYYYYNTNPNLTYFNMMMLNEGIVKSYSKELDSIQGTMYLATKYWTS